MRARARALCVWVWWVLQAVCERKEVCVWGEGVGRCRGEAGLESAAHAWRALTTAKKVLTLISTSVQLTIHETMTP